MATLSAMNGVNKYKGQSRRARLHGKIENADIDSVCANFQNGGTFIHEFNIQYCSIIYPTGLCDKRKTALRQGVSCSINCILLANKSVIKNLSKVR